jgi:hypothetical protein
MCAPEKAMTVDLKELGERILTQDNAITADPIFVVQQRRRVYGFESGYGEGRAFLSDEGDEWSQADIDELVARERVIDAETKEARELDPDVDIDREPLSEDDDEAEAEVLRRHNISETEYRDFWENVQPFFTRAGAEHYMAINGHNLSHPRLYVDSAFRNAEWQAVRAYLASLATPQATAEDPETGKRSHP